MQRSWAKETRREPSGDAGAWKTELVVGPMLRHRQICGSLADPFRLPRSLSSTATIHCSSPSSLPVNRTKIVNNTDPTLLPPPKPERLLARLEFHR